MSLIITLYVREGIVMASDSRITCNTRYGDGDDIIIISQTDSAYKTFLAKNKIGISYCGDSDINGVPITGFIESFIRECLDGVEVEVSDVPQLLVEYFNSLETVPDTTFHIAGYEQEKGVFLPYIYSVTVKDAGIEKLNEPDTQGAYWSGETDVMSRLLQPVAIAEENEKGEKEYFPMPEYAILWQYFTLQDAIDFAVYAIKTTIDTMRFQARPKSVGGPIDVLVIKPEHAFFIKRKLLEVR